MAPNKAAPSVAGNNTCSRAAINNSKYLTVKGD